MPNTFNKDFRRALNAKVELRGAQTRAQDADALLNRERAAIVAPESQAGIGLTRAQTASEQARASAIPLTSAAEANLANQRAREARIGTNVGLGTALATLEGDRFNLADIDYERGGTDSFPTVTDYGPYSNPSGRNAFGDRIYSSDYDTNTGRFTSFSNYANGGAVSIGGADSGFTADYELYRQAADNAGVPALPVREAIPIMAQLRENRRKQVLDLIARGGTTPQGYARGGEIDGPGTGKSDSIPAVVDGVAPAAVSDGEFHIPKHVVDYYGTKMLDGLVEKARMAMKAAQRRQGAGYAQGGAVKKPPAGESEEEPLRFTLTKEEIAANNAPLTADDIKNMEAGKRARARFEANAAKSLPEGYQLEGFSGKTYGDLYNYLQSGPGVVEYLQAAYGVGPEPASTVVAAR